RWAQAVTTRITGAQIGDAGAEDHEEGQEGDPGHGNVEVDDPSSIALAADRPGDKEDAVGGDRQQHQAAIAQNARSHHLEILEKAGRLYGAAQVAIALNGRDGPPV